jgi:hypothetical protein
MGTELAVCPNPWILLQPLRLVIQLQPFPIQYGRELARVGELITAGYSQTASAVRVGRGESLR